MAYTTVQVQGLVTLPTDEPAANHRLKFELKKVDKDSALVVPHELYYSIPDDGNIDVPLWPNARGNAGTIYYVYLIPPREPDPSRHLCTLTVPDVVGPVNIWDHVDVGPPATLSDAEAAELAAQGYAAQALVSQNLAEAAALTQPYDIGSFSLLSGVLASQVLVGGRVRITPGGYTYQRAADNATDEDLDYSGVKWYVEKGADGAYHTNSWGIQPGIDESTKFNAALAKAGNGTLVINFNVAAYIGDRLIPAANTTIKFEPGTVYKAITGGTRAIQVQGENIHVWGYGARVELDGSQNSHAVLITGGGSNIAKNCSVRGLHAKGSGNSGDDCFYIGGDVASGAIPENIQIIDCKGEGIGANTRNCVSVVACDGYLIEGCEFWNATGSPGAGIDLEANLYKTDGSSAIRRGVIRRNKVHSCDSGIASVFADDCIIEDNEVYGNAGDGIGSAAGGTQFDDAIYRTGDRLGVISFASDGWITVEDTNLLTDDLGIEVGTTVARRTESGAAWPTAFNTTYYIVNEISADQFSFRIGTDFDYGTITNVTGSGTGTLDKDPTVSDMHFNVYRAGNNSNMTIRRNTVFGNGSGNSQIKLSQMVNVFIEDNIVTASTTSAISVSYSQNVRAEKNRCQPAVLSTSIGRGINMGVCSEVSTRKNRLYGFGGEGLGLSGSQVESDGDRVLNCGHSVNRSARFQFGTGQIIRGIVVRNDANYPSSSGLRLENTVTDSVVIGARCKNAGADNDSSIIFSGTNVRAVDCMVNDGTFYGEKSITWNAPSIANGASNTTPHVFTGTRAGDFVIATLENNTAGLSISASAYNNGVRVTVTNNTGSTVDLAETTLHLKSQPRS